MKKTVITILSAVALSVVPAYGQWTYKTINSDFDGYFKKAYTKESNSGHLIMEEGDPYIKDGVKVNRPFLAIKGSYYCDDYANIDFVFVVDGVNVKYTLKGTKTKDSSIYYFDESIWTDEFIKDFQSASKCLVRVNQDYCQDDYYEFSFSGSTAAYNFIVK